MAGIKLKTTKAQKLAYLEHTGDYRSIPYDEYFNRLYEWAKEKKVRPGFNSMGIFYDNPEETPPEQCKSEIGIPIVGDAESEEDIKIKELPSMEVAVTKHKGSTKEYQETYRKLNEWIMRNGYEWAGPAMEVYTKKPKTVGEETIVYATVQVPVKKKVLLRKLVDKEETESSE
ncbi:MAG: GyrI-like domain-containing protein [Thermoplasmata archaeon]